MSDDADKVNGNGTGEEGKDDFNFGSEYDSLSPSERKKKVDEALYDAATSGNVTAILHWQAMHGKAATDDLAKPDKGKPKKPKTKRERAVTVKEWGFVTAYFGEAKGNGTLAAKMAGYKGSDNVLATTAYTLLRKPKIQKIVAARLESAILPIEQVLKGISEIALGSIEFFVDIEGETPAVMLKKAKEQGKLHLIQDIQFHPNGQVKGIKWYNALQARIALGRFYQVLGPLPHPEKPPAEESEDQQLTDAESRAAELELARQAIALVMKKYRDRGADITLEEARLKASQHFPLAKEVDMLQVSNMEN